MISLKNIRHPKVLIRTTSSKTKGGITTVLKMHEYGFQWKKFHCKWIEPNIDLNWFYKVWYFVKSIIQFILFAPFYDIIHMGKS